jgi:uncharacterized ferritin-like protein (DUF455 family)
MPAMNSVFALAEVCLQSPDIEEKLAVTARAVRLGETNELDVRSPSQSLAIEETVFPERPELIAPHRLPRRNPASAAGAIALLHSVAHIEFVAIHLAWDILYRFRDMPKAFYGDWLQVAGEEALHFTLVRQRLRALGSDYGRLPAHRGLWDIAEETDGDLLARLALVPRYMEARGLDVTPGMIEKFHRSNDPASAAVLTRILNDEIGHVAIGTRWFHYVCNRRALAPEQTYFELLQRHLRGTVRGPFNIEARSAAGFSSHEIERLQQLASANG